MSNQYQFRGQWIGAKQRDYQKNDHEYYLGNSHNVFSQEFTLNKVEPTEIFIAALGFYTCKINGKLISDAVLNSDWTNYSKRIYFDRIDITELLCAGTNNIEIELGNGMYNPAPLQLFGKYNLRERLAVVGDPVLKCDLLEDSKKLLLVSDEKWKVTSGDLIFNNYYIGEVFDGNYQSNTPDEVTVYSGEKFGELHESFIPKCKEITTLKPIGIWNENGRVVVDFGRTIAGFIDLKLNLTNVNNIEIKYAESMNGNKLNFYSAAAGNIGMQIEDFKIPGGYGAPEVPYQKDEIRNASGQVEFKNRFTYHSFRYVEINGCSIREIEQINAIVVHTNVVTRGEVTTDNGYLNELFNIGTYTKLNNIHSVFEDCAREKLAYGGDMVALVGSNTYLFEQNEMLKKTIMDFRIEQSVLGGIPETAPYMGIQSRGTGDKEGPILWQLVYPYLCEKYYRISGDKSLIVEEYPFLKKQINYLSKIDIDVLATKCIGDHGSPAIAGKFYEDTPDKTFVGYCTIALFYQTMIKIASIIGENTTEYNDKLNNILLLIDQKFKNEDGSYGDKTQTSYAFALKVGIGNVEQLKKQLEKLYEKANYQFDMGIFGSAFMYEMLHEIGLSHIVEKWLIQDGKISFKQMIKNGNQVLSELFIVDGANYASCNHAMFSSYQQWYFEALAGIKLDTNAIGFNKIIINPYFASCTNQVSCKIKVGNEEIKVNWHRSKDGNIIYEVDVPKKIEVLIKNKHCFKEIDTYEDTMMNTYRLIK